MGLETTPRTTEPYLDVPTLPGALLRERGRLAAGARARHATLWSLGWVVAVSEGDHEAETPLSDGPPPSELRASPPQPLRLGFAKPFPSCSAVCGKPIWRRFRHGLETYTSKR